MVYLNSKGVGRNNKKVKALKALRPEDWQAILQAVEDSEPYNADWHRDYALIFLGAAIGMRRGEIHLFQRHHFRDMIDNFTIYCPTLKQSEKIKFRCKGYLHDGRDCGRMCHVKASAAGQEHTCYRCGTIGTVPTPKGELSTGVVDVEIDVIDEHTIHYIQDYLDHHMRPDQEWLFEGWKGKHICDGTVNRIFNTFLVAAGLDPRYSYHSLRHRRGVQVYTEFKDLVLVKKSLRHKNIATSQIYADLDAELKEQYRAQLSKKAFDPLKKRKKAAEKKAKLAEVNS